MLDPITAALVPGKICVEDREQLVLPLQVSNPHSLEYFVPHSGVAEALALLHHGLNSVCVDPSSFRLCALFGPKGVGKSHLLRAFHSEALRCGLPTEKLVIFDSTELEEGCALGGADWASHFIDRYERLRGDGGLLLLASRLAPEELSDNPHLRSRFLAGSKSLLQLPREEELLPVLKSLFERRNLRVSDFSLEYLINRLPSDPLSFDAIVAKIDRFSWENGLPATQGAIRKVVADGVRPEEKPDETILSALSLNSTREG